MKEVKRFSAVPCAVILGCEDIGDIQLTDIEQCVAASDFDSIVKELEGKLKVAVEHIHHAPRCSMIQPFGKMACDCGYHEALAQIEGK